MFTVIEIPHLLIMGKIKNTFVHNKFEFQQFKIVNKLETDSLFWWILMPTILINTFTGDSNIPHLAIMGKVSKIKTKQN